MDTQYFFVPDSTFKTTVYGVDYYRNSKGLFAVALSAHQEEFIRRGASIIEDPNNYVSYPSNGSFVPVPQPASFSVPYEVTLVNSVEQVVIMEGIEMPRALSVVPESGDTVRVRWQDTAGGNWQTLGSYIADFEDMIDLSIYALGFTRTAGSSVLSTVTIS